MARPQDLVTAAAYAEAIHSITGVRPEIEARPDFANLRFGPSQQIAARAWVERQLSARPGAVRVDLMPVILPVALKRLVPLILGAFALGFLASSLRK